jgi:hypothetical protein
MSWPQAAEYYMITNKTKAPVAHLPHCGTLMANKRIWLHIGVGVYHALSVIIAPRTSHRYAIDELHNNCHLIIDSFARCNGSDH